MANSEASTKALMNAATDPVCRMEVYPGRTRLVAIYSGHTYWFCSEDCRTAFEMNPRKYVNTRGGERKGLIRRYFERITKVNREKLGSVGPKCH